ncbi:diacylglycerol kinase family protein [Galbibacter sp. PAP.153]|uniref:diacylglycerol/lipid kinase family protein n=1 Tax=Galbibacter sp. PAP.153 TaxID=3104623 RepID=UPI00300BC73C
MQKIVIIHNPTAGSADHSKNFLMNLVDKSLLEIEYISTKEEAWKEYRLGDEDLILLAGGDGTVRKLFEKMLDAKWEEKRTGPQVVLLPLGKANNISKTLNIKGKPNRKIIYNANNAVWYNYGNIEGLKEENFFIESMGFGVFPQLLSIMKDLKTNNEAPEIKIKLALEHLIKVVKNYPPVTVEIKVEGINIEGSFLLAELMKIKHIGPNLQLAPHGAINDECFYLILITEGKREAFIRYLSSKLENKHKTENINDFAICIQTKKAKIKAKAPQLHIDDNLLENYSGKYMDISIKRGVFTFIENIKYP